MSAPTTPRLLKFKPVVTPKPPLPAIAQKAERLRELSPRAADMFERILDDVLCQIDGGRA